MADSFIQLPADSTGKQLDTVIVNMGVGATQVHREKMVVADPISTSGLATVSSSQGLQVSSTQAQTISGTVTVLSASSGLVQISGTATVLSASSGLVQISGTPAVTSTFVLATPASTAGVVGPITSSAGQLASLSSGTVTLSSAHVVSLSSGTVTLSSSPTVINASSGIVQVLTSGTLVVVNVSSGVVQTLLSPTATTSGLKTFSFWSTGGVVTQNVQSGNTGLYGWAIYNSTSAIRSAKIYASTAPTAGSTTGLLVPVTIPGSTGGGGTNLYLGHSVFSSAGLAVIITANANATDTGAAGANDVACTVFYV